MPIELELSRKALVEHYAVMVDARVSNVYQLRASKIEIEIEGESLENSRGCHFPKIAFGEVTEKQIKILPTVACEDQFRVLVKVQRNRHLSEFYEGAIIRRVHKTPQNQQELNVFMGDIKSERAVGYSDGEGSLVGHNLNLANIKSQSFEVLIDQLNNDGEIGYERVALALKKAEPQGFSNSLGMNLIGIPSGQYEQGSPISETGRQLSEASRPVRISKAFWLAQTEITQAQWREVMGREGCKHPEMSNDKKPANGMSWEEACEFCQILTERERSQGRLLEGYEYSLPTEAQWEYCCRAGDQRVRYGALEKITSLGRFSKVAQCEPNHWGVYDMLGNVYEWCLDSFQEYYPNKSLDCEENPFHEGKNDDCKVIRGGSFQDPEHLLRAAARVNCPPDTRSGRIGFRVVLVESTH